MSLSIPQVLPQRCQLPVYQPPIWSSHCPIGVHRSCERSQAHRPTTGNQTTPIFGRLVDSSSFQRELHQTNTDANKTCEGPRFCSKPQEVGTRPLSEIQFPRIPLFIRFGSCEAHTRQVDKASGDVPSPLSLKSVISVRTLMFTIGLLASTEKTVKLGRIHRRPFSGISKLTGNIRCLWTHQSPGIR